MKWSIGLLLSVSLVFCASVSHGAWRMRIHKGATVQEHAVADVDSLTFYDQTVPPGMVWIPPGNVRLGQVGIAEPVDDFYVEGFFIDRYEVTNAKYNAFINAGGYTNEAYWSPVGWAWRVANGVTLPFYWNMSGYYGGGIAGNEQFPVRGVSWFEADAYCRWAGGRLPTEVEWEKAAKGGCETHGDPDQCDASDTPSYPWGEGITHQQANYCEDHNEMGCAALTPVGYYDGSNHSGFQTINSPSPCGLYDVAGSVWEWCSTQYADYPYDRNDGREDPPVVDLGYPGRVARGGSFYWPWGPTDLRCATRGYFSPGTQVPDVGFRCVKTD